jgi:aminomethyltransferase
MKKTIFHDTHVLLGAKMAPFGGYIMPIQYDGIMKEHLAARTHAALFDTCHMGEFRIEGKTACSDLDAILSCDVSSLKTGRCKYGFICNPEGGTIDDMVIYRISETVFFMVVNASTQENDFCWIRDHLLKTTTVIDLSQETAKIDLQGPHCIAIIQKLLENPILDLTYYSFMYNSYKGKEILISRTGYTGEIGFEIYCDEKRALQFWMESMELGAHPAGLGARDTLRLEMGFPLYDHELDKKRNAAEAHFVKAIATNKRFIGSEVVCDPSRLRHILAGILLDDRRAGRSGDKIYDTIHNEIGQVTSGSFGPSIGRAIAMGYIVKERHKIGEKVMIANERFDLSGEIVELPFYHNGTARKKLSDFL